MKKCTACGIEKELTEFSKHKRNPDGLQYWCRECCPPGGSVEEIVQLFVDFMFPAKE